MLPGWVRVRAGAAVVPDTGLLREMLDAWPFFRGNRRQPGDGAVETDMGIATRYAALVENRALADGFSRGSAMRGDHPRQASCGDGTVASPRESSRARGFHPIGAAVHRALNLLQVELLKRHRSGEADPRVREGIQLSINAIATALRNSG